MRPLYLGEENLTMTPFSITLERIPGRLLAVATLVGTRAAGDLSPQGTAQTLLKDEPAPPTSGGSFSELLCLPHLGEEP